MYPNNIKPEKVNRFQVVKTKIKCLKDEMKGVTKYLWHNRKQLSKIIMVKLHI